MKTATVRFRRASCLCTFKCENVPLEHGDACIVKSDRGLEFGVCVVPPEPCDAGSEKAVSMSVVRKANQYDVATYDQIRIQEDRARAFCIRKIQERNLPMKLIDAEYTFDKRKIVFYFTAEERVDFRELVRDLAHELRTRIELRHIQVRDEAKMVGGLGPCGLELCCKRWLRDFVPISMKMAKRQNLSLNPAKISGQCGRLMCCLSYENYSYPGKKKDAEGPGDEEIELDADEAALAVYDDEAVVAEAPIVAYSDEDAEDTEGGSDEAGAADLADGRSARETEAAGAGQPAEGQQAERARPHKARRSRGRNRRRKRRKKG